MADLETGSTSRLPRWLRRFAPKPITPPVFTSTSGDTFALSEKQLLLALARSSMLEAVAHLSAPHPNVKSFPPKFLQPRGCFVTLTNDGDLRGCIGQVIPQHPLYKAVMHNAHTAALNDSRFDPVHADELEHIDIELSVLSPLVPLEFASPADLLQKLQPGRDGVVLRMDGQGATFLPQVWKHYPDKEDFLTRLAQKAGCGPHDWRKPGATVLLYTVEAFSESELKPRIGL